MDASRLTGFASFSAGKMYVKNWTPTAAAVAACCALGTFSSDVAAHGGIPRAYEILAEPGNAEHMILRSYLWGFFGSRDGGNTWQYTCAEAYQGRSTNAQTRSIAMVSGGRVLVANFFEGLHLTDDGCQWRKHPAFPEAMITDVRLDPHVQGRLFLASSFGDGTGFDSKLFRSDDRGDTWQQAGPPLPRDVSPAHIAFAPSSPSTLYVSGKGYNSLASYFLRSRDGGATFERFQLPVERDRWLPRIQAVHPTRPGLIFIWVDGEEELGEDNPDEYLVTVDEGATWKQLFQGKGDLPGFVISPDGTKIHIAGSLDGIYEADMDRAIAQGPTAFEQVYTYPVWSLRWSAEGLLAGGNNYSAIGDPEFTLGLSTDGGRTFTPLMTVCDLQFSACPAESSVGKACTPIWESKEDGTRGFAEEYVDVRCAGSPTGGTGGAGGSGGSPSDAAGGSSGAISSGGTNAAAGETKGGCGCSAPRAGQLSRAAPLGIAFLAGLFFRRRRRSRVQSS